MRIPQGAHYVDGAFGSDDGPEQQVVDPATGEVLWTYPADTPATVERAIDAAAAALPGWAGTTPGERSGALHSLAAELDRIGEELAQVETAQAGKPIRLSREFDVPGSVDNVAFFAGAARRLDGMAAAEWDGTHTSTIRREPVGVVGSIAPWNYPL
jgi:betaine-aldehyde dehydrogenase